MSAAAEVSAMRVSVTVSPTGQAASASAQHFRPTALRPASPTRDASARAAANVSAISASAMSTRAVNSAKVQRWLIRARTLCVSIMRTA